MSERTVRRTAAPNRASRPKQTESRGSAPAFTYGWNGQHLASTQRYVDRSTSATLGCAVGAGTRTRTGTSFHSGTCEVPASTISAIPATRYDRLVVGTARNGAPAGVKFVGERDCGLIHTSLRGARGCEAPHG